MFISPNPPINMTNEDIAWMASIPYTTNIFNVLICLWFVDNISRRKMIFFCVVVNMTIWLFLCIANSVNTVLCCLFILGFVNNFIDTTYHVYVGEVNSPKNREIIGI